MSESSPCVKQNGMGPDFLGYYMHLVKMLYAQNNSEELDDEETMVTSSEGGIMKDLSGSELERLEAILNESVNVLNEEVENIFEHTLAKFRNEANRNKKVTLPKSSCPGEGKRDPLFSHKRKLKKSSFPSYPVMPRMSGVFPAFQEKAEICAGPSKSESDERLCDKIAKMQEGLEEYLKTIVSKCRVMTSPEKQKLGQQIKDLPPKALNRIVMIIHHDQNGCDKISDKVHVDLDKQDNCTLWKLYYYVKTLEKANNIS